LLLRLATRGGDRRAGVEQRDPLVAECEPLLGCGAIDFALHREDRVDAAHRFDGERRLAQISRLEEFATAVAPARGLGDRARLALCVIEITKPGPRVRPLAGPRTGASVGLEDPGIAGEVAVRVLAATVA
jgi:hypothetical protein